MNTIISIGSGVCITMIVTAIYSLLISNRSMERVMRFALSLFFLTVLIYPLLNMDFTNAFDFSSGYESSFTEKQSDLSDSVLELTQLQLEKQAKTMLETSSIPYQKVEVTIHNDDETGITISKLIVWLDDVNMSAVTKDCLQNYFGIEPEIKIGE